MINKQDSELIIGFAEVYVKREDKEKLCKSFDHVKYKTLLVRSATGALYVAMVVFSIALGTLVVCSPDVHFLFYYPCLNIFIWFYHRRRRFPEIQ